MDRSSVILDESVDSPVGTDCLGEMAEGRENSGQWDPRGLASAEEQSWDRAGDDWEIPTEYVRKSSQEGQDYFTKNYIYSRVAAGNDTVSGNEVLEKACRWGFEVSCKLWAKLEPHLLDYMPEDRNPFVVCSVVVFVVFLAIAGLQIDIKQFGASKNIDVFPIKAPYVKLPDGRRIAYHEQGVIQDIARHTVLVLHGFPSSRLAGIPGIQNRLLEEFGVRLISYDRPGFGQSDVHPPRRNLRASARDMAWIADALGLGEKFWVFAYSTGGVYAWAAMKYIPERLTGVAMFAPVGNLYAPNMTKQETSDVWGALTLHRRLMYMTARWTPSLLSFLLRRTLINKVDKVQSVFFVNLGKKDQELMEQEVFIKALKKDVEEAVRLGKVPTLAHELVLQVRPWGFHLSDLRIRKKMRHPGLLWWIKQTWKKEEEEWEGFSGPIHIWQGDEDQVVPLAINEFAMRMVPQATLHVLQGEGHYSYFWFCEHCHRDIFLTLFSSPKNVNVPVTAEDPASGF